MSLKGIFHFHFLSQTAAIPQDHFLSQTQLEFQVGDVHVPDVPGPFTTLYARARPLFLDPRTFSEVEHYGRLMGYDKPIDLHMRSDNDEEEEVSREEDSPKENKRG